MRNRRLSLTILTQRTDVNLHSGNHFISTITTQLENFLQSACGHICIQFRR